MAIVNVRIASVKIVEDVRPQAIRNFPLHRYLEHS